MRNRIVRSLLMDLSALSLSAAVPRVLQAHDAPAWIQEGVFPPQQ